MFWNTGALLIKHVWVYIKSNSFAVKVKAAHLLTEANCYISREAISKMAKICGLKIS